MERTAPQARHKTVKVGDLDIFYREAGPKDAPAVLLLHGFRFIGLAFLVPGVVSPELPAAFAEPAGYGDLVAAVLALVALAALRTPFGIALVWVFNLWGAADLLHAYYQGRIGVGVQPGQLGAAYFIPTVVVPLLLVTHFLAFRLLLRGEGSAAPRASLPAGTGPGLPAST